MVASPLPSIFCRRLKEARLAVGLSQKRLGIAAGIDEFVASTRINRYELGVHDADLKTATRLADVLGVPLPWLYAEDDLLADIIRCFSALSLDQKRELLQQARSTVS